jgi:hypothetical protein
MKLFCPDCGAAVPAGDMNLSTSTAKCRQCNSVFTFDPSGAEHRSATRPAAGAAPVPQPRGLRVVDDGARWSATWRWFTPGHLFLLFFCIAWDAFLIFWYSIAFSTHAPWIMVVFPVAHLAVGVGLSYATLAGFLNTTRVEVSPADDTITVHHGPLPWAGNRTLAASEVQQLYCERTFTQSKNSAPTPRFQLSAVLRDGSKLPLLKGFGEPDKAMYLEQQIERMLHLANQPVAGEYRG